MAQARGFRAAAGVLAAAVLFAGVGVAGHVASARPAAASVSPWAGAFHPAGSSPGVLALRSEPLRSEPLRRRARTTRQQEQVPAQPQSCTLPAPPAGAHATAGANSATVGWSTSTDGSITGYIVREATGHDVGASIATGPSATSATVTGLSGGTAATFSVAAENSCGVGQASATGSVAPTGSASTYLGAVQAAQPVVLYRMADPSGSVMADSSGNGADGAYTGQQTLGQPAALSSDPAPSTGYTDCCSGIATAVAGLPAYDNPRTAEAWIRTSDSTSGQAVMTWGTNNTDEAFIVSIGAAAVNVDAWNDYVAFPTPRRLDDNAWHFIAVTYDGTNLVVYLDGQSVGTAPFSGQLNTLGTTLWLASAPYGNYYDYNGNLADATVFGTALTAKQVAGQFAASGYSRPGSPKVLRASYGGDNAAQVTWGYATAGTTPLTGYLVSAKGPGSGGVTESVAGDATAAVVTGLAAGSYTFTVQAEDPYGSGPAATTAALNVPGSASTYVSAVLSAGPSAFYRLDDQTASFMADSSGGGSTGFLTPNATVDGPAALASDPAPSTADNGQTLAQAFPSLPTGSSPRSMEAWFRTTSSNFAYLAGYGASQTAESFAIGIQPGGESNALYLDQYGQGLTFTSPTRLDDGNWHFVAVTTDGTTATGYIDGHAAGTGEYYPNPPDTVITPDGLIIGGTPWSNAGLNGAMADVAVFPTALSAAQVQGQFAASGYSTPAAPTAPTVTAGANSASVGWTAPPASDPAITGYVVTALAGGTKPVNSVSVPANATKATVSGLAGGNSYTFTVAATDEYGAGATAATSSVTPSGTSTTYDSTVLSDGPSAFYRLADSSPSAMTDSAGGPAGQYSLTATGLGQAAALASDPSPSVTASGQGVGQSYPSLPLYDSSRTLEAWISTTDANYQIVGGYGGTSSNEDAFALGVSPYGATTDLYLDLWQVGVAFQSQEFIDDGHWHFIAVTLSGSDATAYLDGTSLGTHQLPATPDTLPGGGQFLVGGAPWGGDFNGGLADMALFPSALSTAQIRAQFTASGYGVPPAAASPSATAGANSAEVSWTASPSSDPGVQGYLVTALAGGTKAAQSVSVPGTATSATLTGLAGGTSYLFRVQPENYYGLGPAEATTQAVTPSGPATTYASTVVSDKPAAFYRLADSGPAMADSSGSGPAGAYSPNAAPGQPGPLANDGATAVATSGFAANGFPSVPLGSAPRTLEAWLQTSNGGFADIAGYGSCQTGQGFALGVMPYGYGNAVEVDGCNDGVVLTSPVYLDDDNWHFVAVTTNGTTATAYVDGVDIGSGRFSTPLHTTFENAGLTVGEAPWGGGFSGNLADVALFPRILTPAQVAAQFAASGYGAPGAPGSPTAKSGPNSATVSWIAPPASSPPLQSYIVTALAAGATPANSVSVPVGTTTATVAGLAAGVSYDFSVRAVNAYGTGPAATTSAVTPTGSATTYDSTVLADGPSAFYRLADGAKRVMTDSSSHQASNAYWASGVTLGQTGPFPTDPSTAAAGDGQQIGRAFPALPLYSRSRTLEGWIDTTNGNFMYIGGYGNESNGEAFAVAIQGSEVYIAGYNDDVSFTAPAALDDGNWHMVAVTTDGTSATAYVDGSAIGTQTFGSPLDTLNSPNGFVVGAAPWGQGWSGDLADVAVFPSALTASQVEAQYQESGL